MYNEILFTNILRLLDERDMTKNELAEKADISNSFLSDLTNGNANPSLKIMEAIADVHRGNSPMSGHIARKVVQYFNQRGNTDKDIEKLTKREREVLERLAQGIPYKEIADVLSLSIDTVRMHIKGIYSKLHVHSRGEAVAKYLRK